MRKITGTVTCTNKQWLPVLATIQQPHLRRQNCVLREKENRKVPRSPDPRRWTRKPKTKVTEAFFDESQQNCQHKKTHTRCIERRMGKEKTWGRSTPRE